MAATGRLRSLQRVKGGPAALLPVVVPDSAPYPPPPAPRTGVCPQSGHYTRLSPATSSRSRASSCCSSTTSLTLLASGRRQARTHGRCRWRGWLRLHRRCNHSICSSPSRGRDQPTWNGLPPAAAQGQNGGRRLSRTLRQQFRPQVPRPLQSQPLQAVLNLHMHYLLAPGGCQRNAATCHVDNATEIDDWEFQQWIGVADRRGCRT